MADPENFLFETFVLLLLSVSSSEESMITATSRVFSLLPFFLICVGVLKKQENIALAQKLGIKYGNRETGRLPSKPGELTGMYTEHQEIAN